LPLFIYIALHPLHLIAQLKRAANSIREDIREKRHRNCESLAQRLVSELNNIDARNASRFSPIWILFYAMYDGGKKQLIKRPFKQKVSFANYHPWEENDLHCKTQQLTPISDRQLNRSWYLIANSTGKRYKRNDRPYVFNDHFMRELNQFYSRSSLSVYHTRSRTLSLNSLCNQRKLH